MQGAWQIYDKGARPGYCKKRPAASQPAQFLLIGLPQSDPLRTTSRSWRAGTTSHLRNWRHCVAGTAGQRLGDWHSADRPHR